MFTIPVQIAAVRNLPEYFLSRTRLTAAILITSLVVGCGGGSTQTGHNATAEPMSTSLPAALVGFALDTSNFKVNAIVDEGAEQTLQNLRVDPVGGTWSGTMEVSEGNYTFILIYYIRDSNGTFVAVAKTNPTASTNISAGQSNHVSVGTVATENYIDTDGDGTPNLTEIERGTDWEVQNVSPEPQNVQIKPQIYNLEVEWDLVLGASAYNIVMAAEADVTTSNWNTKIDGMQHIDVTSPFTHPAPLSSLKTYCFVVTAFNKVGESIESEEVCAMPFSANTGDISPLFSVGNSSTGIASTSTYSMEYSLGEPLNGISASTNFQIAVGVVATDPDGTN